MHRVFSALMFCLVATAAEPLRTLSIAVADGGSVVTRLLADIAVNKGSSLHRRWVIINDGSCPIQLGTIGVTPVYRSERYSGSYAYVVNHSQGTATATTDVRAVRIVFTQFDIWGNRDRGLAMGTVTDIAAGSPVPFEGSWYATENDVKEFFTSVAYVDQVMLPDGKIWTANRASIAAKLAEVQLKVTGAALDPDPPKQPATSDSK